MSSFIKDLLAVFKSKVTVILCGVLTSIITARYLGPSGSGILATLIVYPDLLMSVGSMGVRQSTAFYIGQNKRSTSDIFSAMLSTWIFSSVVCLIACFILLKYVTKEEFSNTLIFLALLPLPFSLLTTYASGVFLGMNKIKEFNTVNWIPNVIKLISYVLLIIVLPLNIYGALIGISLGYVILLFFVWRKIRSLIEIKLEFDFPLIKQLFSLGVIYAVCLLVINLNYKVDVVLLERLSTSFEIGIYTKGVSIVEHLWDIPTLLSTIIFARSATAKDNKLFSYKVAQLLRICFIVILLVSVVFFFASEFIMVTMYGKGFAPSATVQKLLLPGVLLLTIFKVLNMDLAGKGKPWVAMIAMIPALVINVILNFLWDAKYGANGAALASTISYASSAILFLYMYSKHVEIPISQILRFSMSDFDFVKEFLQKLKKKTVKI